MIEIISGGNLFASNAEALVNTVNCVGVAGKGIALQFRARYPLNYAQYKQACRENRVQPGLMFVTEARSPPPRYIVNFPTKRLWRSKSYLVDIVTGLRALAKVIEVRDIKSIAIPALGCNSGGLSWRVVRLEIERALAAVSDGRIISLYEPWG